MILDVPSLSSWLLLLMKDGTEKSDSRAAKKGGKKPNPVEQSFAQLSERSDSFEKVIKKKDTKKRKRCCSNSDSDSE